MTTTKHRGANEGSLTVEVRGEVEIEITLDVFGRTAWLLEGGDGMGRGVTYWDAVCDAVRVAVCHRVKPEPPHVPKEWRKRRDALRVIADQRAHIRSLEAQLLPNLIHEIPAQDAML